MAKKQKSENAIASTQVNVSTLSWMADLINEADLKGYGLPYSVQTIEFSSIDLAESRQNSAHPIYPVRQDKVEEFAMAYKHGHRFPRIVVQKLPSGLYRTLDGLRRSLAIELLIIEGFFPKSLRIEVYVIESSDEMAVDVFFRTRNLAHGDGIDAKQRLAQAIYCIQHWGLSVSDASQKCNVSMSSLRNHINAEDARKRLDTFGINVDNAGVTSLAALGKVREDNVLAKLGHLVSTCSPKVEHLEEMVDATNRARSHEARLKVIKRFERELKEREKPQAASDKKLKPLRRPWRDEFIRVLRAVDRFLETGKHGETFGSLAEMQITIEADYQIVVGSWKSIEFRMKTLLWLADEAKSKAERIPS